jgi:PAS domain S-box-containing protein
MSTHAANQGLHETSPPSRRKRVSRSMSAALSLAVAAVGLVLSLLVFLLLQEREYRVAQARFELSAQARAVAIQQALSDRCSAIDTLVAFYVGSEEVTRAEFHNFARRLLNSPSCPDLQDLAWVRQIPGASRAAHEAEARREGLADYRITQRDARGSFAAAAERTDYYPVYFAEPEDRCRFPLGFDLASRGELTRILREAALAANEERPLLLATAPLGSAADKTILLAVASVRNSGGAAATPSVRTPLNGFVLGEFRYPELLHQALDRLEHPDIDTYLFADTAATAGQEAENAFLAAHLAGYDDPETEAPPPPGDDAASLQYAESFVVGGQPWTVRCVPAPGFLPQQRSWWPLGTLVCGILLSGLVAGYLFLLTERTARVEKEVAARTAELRTISNAALDAVVMTDPGGNIVHWNPAAERIFGYGREEILGRGVHEVLIPPEYSARAAQGLHAFAASGRGPVVGRVLELEALHKDGSRFPIEISIASIELSGRWWAVAIVRDITQRKHADEALQKEQRLLKQMLDLQERERRLVAYEIHDGLAQQLTGALYKFQAVERLRSSDPPEAETVFAEGLCMLTDAMAETRRLIGGLRPLVLDESGIVAAIDYLIAEHKEHHGPEIEFSHKIHFQRLAPPLESAVFRIVQESLTNACRYSRSAKIRVDVTQLEEHVRVEVQDWGVGFDPQRVNGGHFGLQGIRERARLFGGTAAIDTALGQGTRIRVELPLVESAVKAADAPHQRP